MATSDVLVSRSQRVKRVCSIIFWRIINPLIRPFAGLAPWWILLETTGRKSGRTRRTPLATGLAVDDGMWLNAVHGRHADWVRNLETHPAVRLRVHRRWRSGIATVHPFDPGIVKQMGAYARGGPATMGLGPLLVLISWSDR